MNDGAKLNLAGVGVGVVLLVLIIVISLIVVVAGSKDEKYHGRRGWSVYFHEQEPRCHPNCDGCARCPGYRDSVNRDFLYRAYMSNTTPYAYDNTRHCTSHYYNTCDGRRSGSRDVNTGKWFPILVT